MAHQANCPISEPNKSVTPRMGIGVRPMGGFGFHPDVGIFVPVIEDDDKIEDAYPSGIIGPIVRISDNV